MLTEQITRKRFEFATFQQQCLALAQIGAKVTEFGGNGSLGRLISRPGVKMYMANHMPPLFFGELRSDALGKSESVAGS
eukprot:s49_g85.t1